MQRDSLERGACGIGVTKAFHPLALGRQPERTFGRLERHGRLEPVGAGERNSGRCRLDLDHALIVGGGKGLALLAGSERPLGGDLGVVLGDFDPGDLFIQMRDQLIQVGDRLGLLGGAPANTGELGLALRRRTPLLLQ